MSADVAPPGACALDGLVASDAVAPVLPGVDAPAVVAAVSVPLVVADVLPLGWVPVAGAVAFAFDDGEAALVSAATATLEPRANPHAIRPDISDRLNALLIVFSFGDRHRG